MFEIILIDNNSTDSSLKIADDFAREHGEDLRVVVVSEKRPGASAARNRGSRAAEGRYLAFTDADCITDPDWLVEIVNSFDDDRIGAVAGTIKGYKPAGTIESFHGLFTLQSSQEEKTFSSFGLDYGGFPTANLVVKRDVFEKTGGFDESIEIYGEDYDLCAKIYQNGYKIKYLPGAVVYHKHRSDLKSTWKQGFNFAKAHGLLLSRHFERYLLVEFGRFNIHSSRFPLKAWIDFGSADKKIILIVIVSIFFRPFLFLIPVYFAYLSHSIKGKARRAELKISRLDSFSMAGLLLVKSASMTLGRIWGAFKYKVLCF